MNKLKWVVIFFFFMGCSLLFEGGDTHYPTQEIYKVVYQIGDVLEYHSNTGEVFFLKVMQITKTETASSRHGSGAPYAYQEHQYVIYDSLNRKVAYKTPTTIITSEQPRGYVRWPEGLYGCTTSGCTPSHETLAINGVTYVDVFKFDPPIKKGEIIIWYYTYKQGFVGFELTGNRVFNLVL